MSAICGIIQLDKAPNAANRCSTIQAALQPYGRHAQGLWDGQHVALGSRLTRLLPEDQYDHQPLQGGNGRFVLIADVRLDNRSELGHKLGIPLARLQAMADADVLLAAYEKWEQQLLSHLVGDFAFAIWDKQQQSLFLARDHMGKRPLFYHQGNGWFGFATMPAGLLALPEVGTAPDEERIRDFLFRLPDISSNRSFFSDIHRLLPGHYAVFRQDGSLNATHYWAPSIEERIYFKSDDDYVDAFLEKLEEAVRCRLRSTGGIASQISAGFDSATVTSIAATLLGKTGQHLHAFTSVPNLEGLPQSSKRILNEGPLAAQVTALFANIHHHLIRTDNKNIMDMLEAMVKIYNRPVKNVINQLWMMTIAEHAAAQGATTLLTGVLGNFTISYNGKEALNSLLREGRLIELLHQYSYHQHGTKLRALYRTLSPSLPGLLQYLVESLAYSHKGPTHLEAGINPNIIANRDFQQYCRQLGRYPGMVSRQYESRLSRHKLLRRFDTAEYTKGTLALAGIDTRDPTADIRLIDYCQAIPVEQFNKNAVNRWLLRRALRRYWPTEIIDSRTQGRQGADWLSKINKEQDALSREIDLLQVQPLANKLLDLEVLQKQLAEIGTMQAPDSLAEKINPLRLIAAGHFLRLVSGN